VRLFLDNSILPQAGRSSVKLSLIGNGTAPRIILMAYEIHSVEGGQRLIWPLLADAFAHLWDLPEPPSADEVTQAFGAE
jgi:hypothetical protein